MEYLNIAQPPLELVKNDFTEAIMFDSDGGVLEPGDALYKKNILLLRVCKTVLDFAGIQKGDLMNPFVS